MESGVCILKSETTIGNNLVTMYKYSREFLLNFQKNEGFATSIPMFNEYF